MHVFGGLKRQDWERWGQFTTFKADAVELLAQSLRPDQRVYCSPLVDPYQPAEEREQMMPHILQAVITRPPEVFTIQTRGPLIERDLPLLLELNRHTRLRVSFSVTTDDDRVRALYEPHCESNARRLEVIRRLRGSGIVTHATLAPILPCSPEHLAELAVAATDSDLIGDPFHVRSVKASGATTREHARRIAERHGHLDWFEPSFQNEVVERIRRVAERHGRQFAVGPEGFSWLART